MDGDETVVFEAKAAVVLRFSLSICRSAVSFGRGGAGFFFARCRISHMKLAFKTALALLPLLLFTGVSSKPDLTVRFHVEANERDTERFSQAIQLKYPPRSAYVERVATIS